MSGRTGRAGVRILPGFHESVMERIHYDRNTSLFMNSEAVVDRVGPFIILDDEPVPDGGIERLLPGTNRSILQFIAVDTSCMNLNLSRIVQPHQVEHLCMIRSLPMLRRSILHPVH